MSAFVQLDREFLHYCWFILIWKLSSMVFEESKVTMHKKYKEYCLRICLVKELILCRKFSRLPVIMACWNILPISVFILQSLVYIHWNQKYLIQKILVLQNMLCTSCLLCNHEKSEAEYMTFSFSHRKWKRRQNRAEGGWLEKNRLKKKEEETYCFLRNTITHKKIFLSPFNDCSYVDFHFGQLPIAGPSRGTTAWSRSQESFQERELCNYSGKWCIISREILEFLELD